LVLILGGIKLPVPVITVLVCDMSHTISDVQQ